MVHQLLLVSSIPHPKYVQTISTLQAFTGLLSPEPITTYNLVTKPHNVFRPKVEAGKVNQIEQHYMRCITIWDETQGKGFDLTQPVIKDDEETNIFVERLFTGENVKRHWTLHIADIPIAGKNQTCSAQNIYESTLVHHHTKVMEDVLVKKQTPENGDAEMIDVDNKQESGENNDDTQIKKENDIQVKKENEKSDDKEDGEVTEAPKEHKEIVELSRNRKDSFLQFLEDLGYDVVNQYWIKGIRFFHGDVVIEIYKILIRDDDWTDSSVSDKIKLKLLDESNTFQVKAYVNVSKSTDVDQVNQANKDLLKLKDFLKNLINFEVPDRMYMDSRVLNK